MRLKISLNVWKENRDVRKAFNTGSVYRINIRKIPILPVYQEYVKKYLLSTALIAGSAIALYFAVGKIISTRAFYSAPDMKTDKFTAKEIPIRKDPVKKSGLHFKNDSPSAYPDKLDLLIADKHNNKIHVYSRTAGSWKKILSFDMVTGRNPGPKRVEGDLKTPVGNYWVVELVAGPVVGPYFGSLILKLNFPNESDMASGISGKDIWIHGAETGKFNEPTKGCLKLRNKDIVTLASHINFPVPVIILPEKEQKFPDITLDVSWINDEYNTQASAFKSAPNNADKTQVMEIASRYVELEEKRLRKHITDTLLPREKRLILSRIEKWRDAWKNRDVPMYSSNFHEDFLGRDGRDLNDFVARKKNIFENQDSIFVDVDKLSITPEEDMSVLVEFSQNYSAYKDGRKSMESQSRKQLWLKKKNNDWFIVKE